MKVIVVTDDELKHLEKRFGPAVRQMGPWNSDGTFGYANVPISAVEKAADGLQNPALLMALSRLEQTSERTKAFLELLDAFGLALIENIVAAYKESSLELIEELASKPAQAMTVRVSMATAAG